MRLRAHSVVHAEPPSAHPDATSPTNAHREAMRCVLHTGLVGLALNGALPLTRLLHSSEGADVSGRHGSHNVLELGLQGGAADEEAVDIGRDALEPGHKQRQECITGMQAPWHTRRMWYTPAIPRNGCAIAQAYG